MACTGWCWGYLAEEEEGGKKGGKNGRYNVQRVQKGVAAAQFVILPRAFKGSERNTRRDLQTLEKGEKSTTQS